MRTLLQLLLALVAGLLATPPATGCAETSPAPEVWSADGLSDASVDASSAHSADGAGLEWEQEEEEDDECSGAPEQSLSRCLRVVDCVCHFAPDPTLAFRGRWNARAPPLS